MVRYLLPLCLVAATTPCFGKDVTGPINPGAWSQSMPMEAAIRAQAKGGGQNFRGTGFSERYVRRICAELPSDRARYGPADRRVVRITKVCRKAALLR
jgi:hypothetical protein